uniref:Ancillary SecYEG translocon subunit n=1 Tax=Candidatus Kentrum eta TaxID=2126337 RepID=A0A450VCP4_9GAMM|nr:MAG: Putative negative regulator of RcsB-dependent stress response [Candidatus Kentron sp. H]VFK02582.1 MAG: Putative negative regulator of RcsB-dependent stress response [Candidatus Kentron sp. H]VFK05276.1 MAG: Putative negative regulator of RcsB-dependent stress response [Candidatus Kentron sp. H]
MNTYESEREQLEALQKWWKENGRAIISGILLGTIAISSWSSWQVYTTQQAEKASLHYEQLSASVKSNLHEEAIKQGNALVEEFPNSGYAPLASLVVAKVAFQQNEMEKVKAFLQLAIDQEKSEAVQQIARLRLARLLRDEGKWKEAMVFLDGNVGEFSSLYEEARGDILLAQGNPVEARLAYEQTSAGNNRSEGQSRVRVQTKLGSLGKK